MIRLTLLLIFSNSLWFAAAQKIMQVDSALLANSDALPVKTKAAVTIGMRKYEFGPYKIILVKKGSGDEAFLRSEGSALLNMVELSKSKSRFHFELLANEKDTVRTSVAISSKAIAIRERYLSITKTEITIKESEDEYLEQWNRNCVAVINVPGERSLWQLLYFAQYKPDSSLKMHRDGVLTNDSLLIDINPIKKWDNNKSPTFYSVVGFDFKLNNESVASVQAPVNTFQKKIVWIKNTVDERIRNVLAAAIAGLMGFHESESEP